MRTHEANVPFRGLSRDPRQRPCIPIVTHSATYPPAVAPIFPRRPASLLAFHTFTRPSPLLFARAHAYAHDCLNTSHAYLHEDAICAPSYSRGFTVTTAGADLRLRKAFRPAPPREYDRTAAQGQGQNQTLQLPTMSSVPTDPLGRTEPMSLTGVPAWTAGLSHT